MEDGSNTHIVLQKNSQYACPIYCEVDHIHHAVICKDKKHIENNKFVYHISEKNESGFVITFHLGCQRCGVPQQALANIFPW